ncbi:SAM-dependent methyltransferase [Streptomyces sp. NPDC127037]|uniref:SAM-dependent methyltransferase n=1 Tax=Streptomyces sp. NPDC127037 TaxID=3347113 RepID=UPI00366876A3
MRRLPEFDLSRLRMAATVQAHHNGRVTSHLARRGIDQFLDLGCGYDWTVPFVETLQSYARRVLPACRVVSVDIDHVVIGTRYGAEFSDEETTVQGDLRHMKALLTSDQVSSVLDLSRPVAILLHDVLPCLDDAEAVGALSVLRDWAPAGSALSITHATDLAPVTPSKLTPLLRQAADLTYIPRSWAAVKDLFGGWPLLEPGLVPTARWSPQMGDLRDWASGAYAGVAIKPAASDDLR